MPTNYTLGFNVDQISDKGEDRAAFRIVQSNSASASNENWFDTFYRSKSTFNFEQPLEDKIGESGNVLTTKPGNVKFDVKLTSMQTNSELFNFLMDDVVDRYFAVFLEVGETDSSQNEFLYMPLCQIQRGFNVSAPGREVEVTIKPLQAPIAWNGASISYAGSSITGWPHYNASLSSVTGAAGTYCRFVDAS